MTERDFNPDIEFLRWHAELCREDAARFYRDHLRYEYLRRLNVPQFASVFKRCLKGERFDDVIDACLKGCTPGCREDNYPGCAHCMMPSECHSTYSTKEKT